MASNSADEERIERALEQGEDLGFDRQLVSQVLKDLLKVFENSWEHIEAENYQVLVNQLLDHSPEDHVTGQEHGSSSVPGLALQAPLPPAHSPCEVEIRGPSSSLKHGVRPESQDAKSRTHRKSSQEQTEPPLSATGGKQSSSKKRQLGGAQSSLKKSNSSKGKQSIREPQKEKEQEPEQGRERERRIPPRHDPDDISKGAEAVPIRCVNDYNDEKLPDDFCYIAKSEVYQDAKVRRALATIGDNDCCSKCFGNCLQKHLSCACSGETGGKYAYTEKGLLEEWFLQRVLKEVSGEMDNRRVFCKGPCPMEVAKGAANLSCNGHTQRAFIKECCSKCTCHKRRCGNRIVQQGVRCKLEVFWTPDGKGWGVRCAEELPAGCFICEYAGEVLTNTELDRRNQQRRGGRHTYPVILNADICSESWFGDDDLLCLDATNYGNVARFINHRCGDANLQDVPVQIETPDRHYYHIAFFTNRIVRAYEELTWDYGINFEDTDHPIEAFRCKCGSIHCRSC